MEHDEDTVIVTQHSWSIKYNYYVPYVFNVVKWDQPEANVYDVITSAADALGLGRADDIIWPWLYFFLYDKLPSAVPGPEWLQASWEKASCPSSLKLAGTFDPFLTPALEAGALHFSKFSKRFCQEQTIGHISSDSFRQNCTQMPIDRGDLSVENAPSPSRDCGHSTNASPLRKSGPRKKRVKNSAGEYCFDIQTPLKMKQTFSGVKYGTYEPLPCRGRNQYIAESRATPLAGKHPATAHKGDIAKAFSDLKAAIDNDIQRLRQPVCPDKEPSPFECPRLETTGTSSQHPGQLTSGNPGSQCIPLPEPVGLLQMATQPLILGGYSSAFPSLMEIAIQRANVHPSQKVAAGTLPAPLPPSVEEAYRKKCIELKRRMTEVEENNDAFRLRKVRLTRGIRKMRLERAYLLENLGKRMKKNGNSSIDGLQGVYDEDSEGSSEGPPTPNEKPLRSKRSHRRPIASPTPFHGGQSIIPNNSQPTNHPSFAYQHYDPHSRVPQESPHHPNMQPTNGHPIPLPLHRQQVYTSTFPSDLRPKLPRTPLPPPNAFGMYYENNYLSQPHKYPTCRSDEDLLRMAQQGWADASPELKNLFFKEEERLTKRYREEEKMHYDDMRRYREECDEYDARVRRPQEREGRGEMEEEVSGAVKREAEVEREREGAEGRGTTSGGTVGGFTSINNG